MFTNRKKFEKRIRVDSLFATSVVILANADSYPSQLVEKLKELEEEGYSVGHRFRPSISHDYSEELNSFLGRLELAGYIRYVGTVSLTEAGNDLLERKIMEAFDENTDLTIAFLKDAGLNVEPFLDRYLAENP